MRKDTKINLIGVIAHAYGFRETSRHIWKHKSRPFRFRFSPRKVYFETCRDGKHYESVFDFWNNKISIDDVVAIDHYLRQHF